VNPEHEDVDQMILFAINEMLDDREKWARGNAVVARTKGDYPPKRFGN
jgi:hypothetical protein